MTTAKEALTTWGTVTKLITSTAAVIVIGIATVSWFQPSGTAIAQHTEITEDFDLTMAQHTSEQTVKALETELERIELALKMYATIRERRELTPDEDDELEYLKARRLQIRERLFEK